MATAVQTNPATHNNRSRPTLASPQRGVPPARRRKNGLTRAFRGTCRHQPRQLPTLHRSAHRIGQAAFLAQRLQPGLTARTAILPTEDPEAYQRHIQQFVDEYAPATATETQLVHEIANTAWRLNRIPLLEAELFSQNPNPQTLIPMLAKLGMHGSRLSRQFQKAIDQLRDVQEVRRRHERCQLTEAAELFLRHQRKGLPWDSIGFFKGNWLCFSKEQLERHAQYLMRSEPPPLRRSPTLPSRPAAHQSRILTTCPDCPDRRFGRILAPPHHPRAHACHKTPAIICSWSDSALLLCWALLLAACDRPPEVYAPPEQRHPAWVTTPVPKP